MTQEKAIQEAKIKDFVEKWMNGHEPDTFVKNKHGVFMYQAGSSGINLKMFFEDLLQDYHDECVASSSSEKGEIDPDAVCGRCNKQVYITETMPYGGLCVCNKPDLAHQSSKQFSLTEELLKWFKEIEGEFHAAGDNISIPIRKLKEKIQSLTPKEHSEGECICPTCKSNEIETSFCNDKWHGTN